MEARFQWIGSAAMTFLVVVLAQWAGDALMLSTGLYEAEVPDLLHLFCKELTMRVMVIIHSDEAAEAGKTPPPELFEAMDRFNHELVSAGIMQAAEGLAPTSTAKKVHFKGKRTTVTDGPFAESKEVIAGFWIWKVKSMDEAIEWVKKMPSWEGVEGDVTVRPCHDLDELEGVPESVRESERALRQKMLKNW